LRLYGCIITGIAADYKNEKELGVALAEGIAQGLVKREELFITTKLWNSDHGHVLEACKDSLKNLQIDYLDLYLIHFPIATRHTGLVFRKVLLILTRMPGFSPF
jgi:diketogulonate reductase-like aldo/keto reductase